MATDGSGASATLQFLIQVSAAPVVVPTPGEPTPPSAVEVPEVPVLPIVTEDPVVPSSPVEVAPEVPAATPTTPVTPEAAVLAIVAEETLAVSAPVTAVAQAAESPPPGAVLPPASPATPEVAMPLLLADATVSVDGFQGFSINVETFAATREPNPIYAAMPAELTTTADAVLAVAVMDDFTGITLSSISQALQSTELLSQLQEMRTQLQAMGEQRPALIASSIAVSGSLSIGYVIWLVRGGVLVSSMLSALPAWQLIDPMPVLAAAGGKKRKAADEDGKDGDVEHLFEEAKPKKPEVKRPVEPVKSTVAADPEVKA